MSKKGRNRRRPDRELRIYTEDEIAAFQRELEDKVTADSEVMRSALDGAANTLQGLYLVGAMTDGKIY